MIMVGNIHIPLLTVELKRELGDGGCAPTTQAGITLRQSWIQKTEQKSVIGGIIVIKFMLRYGKEVHEFLANKSYAPHLRYYGPMPNAPPSPPCPKSAPAGLAFGFMQMVVMDYVAAALDPPTNFPIQFLLLSHYVGITRIFVIGTLFFISGVSSSLYLAAWRTTVYSIGYLITLKAIQYTFGDDTTILFNILQV
ncbi:hypothetical protein BYT27DRAFT_7215855 [Phlegmacium glaucopus]|nr:hypothetical protein BYT27DRAFT_7215855 [Phlegmacium glaucopus]